MKKLKYEAPYTTREVVHTEGSFCGSVITGNDKSSVEATSQEVNVDFTSQNDFTDGGWDETTN